MGERALRPANYEAIYERLSKFYSPDAIEEGLAVQLEAEDIVLSSGPKTGTTWVQHILHGLRSRGHLDYEDIHDIFPVLEHATLSWARHDEQRPFVPPMYKTHSSYGESPLANRTIVLTRNPNDAALSLYYFFRHWIFEPEELSLEEFIECFYVEKFPVAIKSMHAHQLRHLASWYPHRKEENILWLHYEDLHADLPGCIRMMAEFIGVGAQDQELLALVEHQASIDFMKKHMTKFDAHNLKLDRNEAAGLDRNAGLTELSVQKVRAGNMNESKEVFSEGAKQMMRQKWMEILKPVTGFNSYEEMRATVNAELGRSLSTE